MFKKTHILSAIIIFYANICLAEIITTNNFKTIEELVKSTDHNTLVIFDIDGVLLQPKDCSLRQYYDREQHKKAKNFFKKLNNQLTIKQQSTAIMQIPVEPIDLKIVKLINILQNRAVKVLALTARGTGKFGKIHSLEDLTIQELKHFGYHFENFWLNLNDQIFDQIPPYVDDIDRSRGEVFFKNGTKFFFRIKPFWIS